jgi:hypothetical protein
MMNRKRLALPTIAVGIVLLLLAACAPPTPEFPTGFFVSADGTYALEFDEDGRFTYYAEDIHIPYSRGTYSIDGNLYTEDMMCHFPATYTWAYDGQNLTFKLFGEDECEPRKGTYTNMGYIGPQ